MIHLLSLSVLCIGFVLCRYVFFDIHGMKQWPVILFVIGIYACIFGLSKQGFLRVIGSDQYVVQKAGGRLACPCACSLYDKRGRIEVGCYYRRVVRSGQVVEGMVASYALKRHFCLVSRFGIPVYRY